MPTLSKPFEWGQKIIRTIFRGRPYIFASQDHNRYLDVIREYQLKLDSNIGAIRKGWEVKVNSIVSEGEDTTFGFTINWSLLLSEGEENAYVYYKGIRFDIPELLDDEQSFSVTVEEGTLYTPLVYAYLIATKEEVLFSSAGPILHIEDPKEFSGVKGEDSQGNSYELASSDNVIYGNERVVLVESLSDIELEEGEEVICLVTTLRASYEWGNSTSQNLSNSKISFKPIYNAIDIDYLIKKFPLRLPTSDSPYTGVLQEQFFDTNGGIADLMAHLIEKNKQDQSFQDFRISRNEADVKALKETVTVVATPTSPYANFIADNTYRLRVPPVGVNRIIVALGTGKYFNSITALEGELVEGQELELLFSGDNSGVTANTKIGNICNIRFTESPFPYDAGNLSIFGLVGRPGGSEINNRYLPNLRIFLKWDKAKGYWIEIYRTSFRYNS